MNCVALLGGLAALMFVFAAAFFPGGGYNPAMYMLSALGRTEVRLVEYPWSLWFFGAGMLFSSLAVLAAARRSRLSPWGAAINALGLVAIAIFPENVSWACHDAACWVAALGGAVMLLRWLRDEPSCRMRCVWLALLVTPMLSLAAFLVLHSARLLPFAPWVPSAQKLVILSFAAWLLRLSARGARGFSRAAACGWLMIPAALAAWLALRTQGPAPADILRGLPPPATGPAQVLSPSADELAGLAWLERVTGGMDKAGEAEWWETGASQHG